jgi:hypothetical protein
MLKMRCIKPLWRKGQLKTSLTNTIGEKKKRKQEKKKGSNSLQAHSVKHKMQLQKSILTLLEQRRN